MSALGGLVLGLSLLGALIYLRNTRLLARREKQVLLERGERRYSKLFNTVSDIVYMHKPDGTILEVNETVSRLFGVSAKELVGRNIREFVGARNRSVTEDYLQKLLRGMQEVAGVLPIQTRVGSKLLILEFRSSVVMQDSGEVCVQGIARNMTDQMRYERSLKKREMQLHRLLEKADLMREDLSLVTRELLKVQEEERLRIGRELHDEIGQLLATITLNLRLMKKTLAANDRLLLERRISDSEKLADEMFGRIRSFLHELRPAALGDRGFIPVVKTMLDEYSDRTGISTKLVDGFPDMGVLDYEKQVVLYRVLQEGLTNIVKHAHASNVNIHLSAANGDVLLTIRDDGDGFEVERSPLQTRQGHGLGLLGMRERLHLVHGQFGIESKVGEGTVIIATIPIDVAASMVKC
jgi:PAS domain S-box-containing protein